MSQKVNSSQATRCTWTDRDDQIMLEVLKTEKDAGNQSENGWKKAVWTRVAAALAEKGVQKAPVKTGEKCQDHFGNLKSDFNDVETLLDKSGFGWDDGSKLVIATDQVWQELLNTVKNKKLGKWRSKPFLRYDDMYRLVKGITATGAGAFHAGANDGTQSSPSPVPDESNLGHDDDQSPSPPPVGEIPQSQPPTSFPSHTQTATTPTTSTATPTTVQQACTGQHPNSFNHTY
ncbi:hypothetical protein BDN72DRAFT_864755 [Pluteus cervinus]|uniref:Uncharacterized protein n=1 Tax=Pluteus cervinus TaxID=181527 RepID=A0ACD3A214_9AGAR|nr:hypothetical protein BDN72DRAFT_864755 [Pluteus cervinus]